MERVPFPNDPEEFGDDSRISYSRTSKTYFLEDENGEEWEWLSGLNKWSKTMDEALMKQQAEIYKVQGVDEDTPALNPAKKRKEAQIEDPASNPKSGKSAAEFKPRENTAVFVTGLPLDADENEVRSCFQKYGVIMQSLEDKKSRVKLYYDKNGEFKGEALVVYFKPESVKLAMDMQDGAPFPRDDYSASTSTITVAPADSSYKVNKDESDTTKERPKSKPTVSKAMAKKNREEMERRIADWSSSDDDPSTMRQTSSRWDKVVVLRNVFRPIEIEEDKDALSEISELMQESAEKFGEVKNVTIFDLEPIGVVTIRFSNAMAAKAFASAFDGRAFGERVVNASIATGDEKFKKTRRGSVHDADEQKRLEEYSNFIEGKTDTAPS